MGRRKTACQICSCIKARCSGDRPCTRCRRLKLTCNYGDSNLPRDTNSETTRTKVWHSRSARGCGPCRRRRRKCDEQLPTCGDCQRLKLECKEVDTERDTSSKSGSASPRPRESSDSQSRHESEPCNSPALRLPSAETGLEEDGTPTLPFAEWISLIQTEDSTALAKIGCLPNSAAQANLLMPCACDDNVGLATYLPPTALNHITGITQQALASWNIADRTLLNHYLQAVSRALAVAQDDDNPFLSVILPLAMVNTTVRRSVLALSACHLSRVYPDWRRDILMHRTMALQELTNDLKDPGNIICTLAATLILCLTEICEGNSKRWLLHLHGARALIASSNDMCDKSDTSLKSMVQLYNYLCCTASSTSENVPLMCGDFDNGNSQGLHPLLGFSAHLYSVLARVNRLAARATRSGKLLIDTEEFRAEAESIELSLQSWMPPEDVDPSRAMSEAQAAAFATQWAVIMRLRQATYRLTNGDIQIKIAADKILSALSLIRPGSEVEARILFPLFMAGVGSMTKPNRQTVEYRMNIMEGTIGLGNISAAHRLLDDIWRRSNAGEVVDWVDLMRATCPGLVLF